MKNHILISNSALFFSMFFFASGFVAVEFLLAEGWHPIQLNFLRHSLVVLILIPIWILFDSLDALLKANWKWGIFVGGLGFGCGSCLLLYSQIFSDPVTITIIIAVFPAVSVILEVILDNRILNRELVIGILISIIGGCIAVLGSEDLVKVSWGAILAIAAVFLFAWASRANVIDFPNLSTLGQTTITMIGSFTFISVIFLILIISDKIMDSFIIKASMKEYLQLTIYAFLGMAFSQFLWLLGIKKIGLGLASIHMNATAFYVMIILSFFGGSWNNFHLVGAIIVGIGVFISQISKKSFIT
ncbi:MAG: hypothetical protein CL523_04250 [Actinomycetales bacterium]|nr:MAG: hypothetical protein CL523_04250 [Actinomycetales bacterium]